MKKIAFLLFFLATTVAYSQEKKQQLPVLKTNSGKLTIVVGNERYVDAWKVNPKLKLDVLDVPRSEFIRQKVKLLKIKFVSAIDSVELALSQGEKINIIILLNNKDTALTQIKNEVYINPATFTKAYIEANNLKTIIEIPPVYELVNIVIALTESASKDKNLIYTESAYYKQVMAHFGSFKDEKIVYRIDSALQNGKYAHIKMDGYSFDLIDGKIQQSIIYDRISWGSGNSLRPYVKNLQEFADKSGFVGFYKKHRFVYDARISCFRDSINILKMMTWLRKNFAGTDYNCFKIIFSPLVAWNQSANRFENNGFKEAQAHINFPYENNKQLSKEGASLQKGSITFTELNHSFIDPEQEKYQDDKNFLNAFNNIDVWIERNKPAGGYNSPSACFNEYMNWALVCLYFVDYAPKEEAEKMIKDIEMNMKWGRGFKKFPEFDQFLIQLYKIRGNKTLSDLYPQINQWFALNKNQ